MRDKIFWIGLLWVLCFTSVFGQEGSAFGIKLGPSIGFQQWNRGGGNTGLLFRYHADAYIETYSPDASYALFAQAGYHVRGGALRLRGGSFQSSNSNNLITISGRSYPYEFNNLVLSIGAKQRFVRDNDLSLFYLVGVRGEYTLSTNLGDYHRENDPLERFNLIHPFPGSNVRKINYGIIVGAGLDFMFSELVGGMLEISISPDFSQQYFSQAFAYVDPITSQDRNISERRIKNLSIELSLGIRLLRIVEYVDNIF